MGILNVRKHTDADDVECRDCKLQKPYFNCLWEADFAMNAWFAKYVDGSMGGPWSAILLSFYASLTEDLRDLPAARRPAMGSTARVVTSRGMSIV